MRPSSILARLIFALAILGIVPERSISKIAFTGYADLRVSPIGIAEVGGDPALQSDPLVGSLFLRPRIESRAFSIASTGIFAATSMTDRTQFLMDITYRDIGATTRTIRIQYAYVEYAHSETLKATFGKIMLPFGYLNDHLFYPFQRDSISPPTFVSSILGLPIADMGAAARKNFNLGPLDLQTDVYAVNGYGPVPTSKNAFRSTGLPGGIQIANNIGASNANHEFSYGGRVKLAKLETPKLDLGISHYRGKWDPDNLHLFEMTVSHLKVDVSRFRFLSEYFIMKARGDLGFETSLGHPHWKTQGFFAELGFDAFTVAKGPLVPWLRYEEYFSSPDGTDGKSREALLQASTGLKVAASESVALKLELSRLRYEIPWLVGKNILLDIWTSLVGVSVSF